jgi:hypothetical protein
MPSKYDVDWNWNMLRVHWLFSHCSHLYMAAGWYGNKLHAIDLNMWGDSTFTHSNVLIGPCACCCTTSSVLLVCVMCGSINACSHWRGGNEICSQAYRTSPSQTDIEVTWCVEVAAGMCVERSGVGYYALPLWPRSTAWSRVLWMCSRRHGIVRGLPVFPVLSYFLQLVAISWRPFPTSSDYFQPWAIISIGDISSPIITEGCTASPGIVRAAFQIWEAWYYTWSLVYTRSVLTKVP